MSEPKRRVIVKQWRWQSGAAITIPWGGQTYILTQSATPSQALIDHERVHASYVEEHGPAQYWLVHLWARVVTFPHALRAIGRGKNPVLQVMIAVEHEIELAGYRAQYPGLSDQQIIRHFRGG